MQGFILNRVNCMVINCFITFLSSLLTLISVDLVFGFYDMNLEGW